MEPLERETFAAADLIKKHPPRWRHRNKQAVFEVASGAGDPFDGTVVYARWPEAPVPDALRGDSRFVVHPGVFVYGAESEPGTCAWHVNFADPRLFVAYGSPLLAQDELQVAEHPILGALCEALESARRPGRTVDTRGRPTPVTVTGAQRRCAIDTSRGLYGNAVARAPAEQVRAATRAISPPTITNILAMAAPAGGRGDYAREEIEHVLATAYTAFLAARLESERLAGSATRPVIHTGFWGCGAFGGNRELMTVLQGLAADLVGADVAFYAFDDAGASLARRARELYETLRAEAPSVPPLLDALVEQGFPWGESDGN